MEDGGLKSSTRLYPFSVQVHSLQGTSVVPINYPIRIKHWNYFEDKVLSKQLGVWIYRVKKVLQNSIHDPRALNFSWMNSG